MIKAIFFLGFFIEVHSQFDFIKLNECKLSSTGTEYMGIISVSEKNRTCLDWNSIVEVQFLDEDFPDGSRASAKNFCRNPTKDPNGPWCFIMNNKPVSDTCNIPFCKNAECRISGPGTEYVGVIDTSISGKKCTKWLDKHKLISFKKENWIRNRHFPDGSIAQADRKCRNPNGAVSGPWCYIEGGSNENKTELCDVPFCDNTRTIMYSDGSISGQYFFFSSLYSKNHFFVNVRLWNPSDWDKGQVFIFLSAYDIALDRQDNDNWKSGVEIKIGNLGSGIVTKGDEDLRLTKTPFILSGGKWTSLYIKWRNIRNSRILVEIFDSSTSELLGSNVISIQGTIFEVENFRFFSLAGSPSIWNIEMINDENCFVHTVPCMNFTRFWLTKKTTSGINLDIFVRAKRNAKIILRPAPMVQSKQVEILISNKNKLSINTYSDENHSKQLEEVQSLNLIDFWKWKYFRIIIIKNKLSIYWDRRDVTELLIEAKHPNIAGVLWVGFASSHTSYWTIYCDPRGVADPPSTMPPECVSQDFEPFVGTLSVTDKGNQCLPWTDKSSIPTEFQNDALFYPYGGKVACENFCRNLNSDPRGPFCIVRDENSHCGFTKEYCHPRPCRPIDCKVAGLGNDYVGKLNETRSKRHCKSWTTVNDEELYTNDFPDPSLKDAQNFCRNPTKSITGCWCFTSDPRVPRDLCAVNDCDRPLECTILVTQFKFGISMYILPSWRKNGLEFWLKAWNPDVYEGLIISFMSIDSLKEYILMIGDEENEKVKLSYKTDEEEVLLHKRTLSHLIPTGKWAGYWLRTGYGKIEVGYKGTSTSFFEWNSSNESYSFEPVFMSYGTVQNHWIGISFRCSECLTEVTSVNKENKIYPLSLWNNDAFTSALKLNIRGLGSTTITIMWTPDLNRSLAIEIDSNRGNISIIQYSNSSEPQALASCLVSNVMSDRKWTEYFLSYTEDCLTIYKDKEQILRWKSTLPLLIYWFSVIATEGTIVWTANCPPPDLDGDPRDGSWGDWGPWSCSVTCGKGHGKVERKCNKPPPNIFGKDCKGLSTYNGPCNDFPCGEITPDTYASIRKYLATQHKSLEVEAKERVLLPCNPKILPSVINEVNDLNITWSHNGFKCSRMKFHVDENFTLIIPHAQEKHNGVYICTAYQGANSVPPKVILEVISLIVIKNKPNKRISKGRPIVLKCNGMALSYVYAELSQRWELNGSIWKDYGIGALEMATTDMLENVNDSHAGIWTCVIFQEDFKFKWTTNWINLKVKASPSFWFHIVEDVILTPFLGKSGTDRNTTTLFFCLLSSLILVTLILICLLVKIMRKKE